MSGIPEFRKADTRRSAIVRPEDRESPARSCARTRWFETPTGIAHAHLTRAMKNYWRILAKIISYPEPGPGPGEPGSRARPAGSQSPHIVSHTRAHTRIDTDRSSVYSQHTVPQGIFRLRKTVLDVGNSTGFDFLCTGLTSAQAQQESRKIRHRDVKIRGRQTLSADGAGPDGLRLNAPLSEPISSGSVGTCIRPCRPRPGHEPRKRKIQ